MSQFDIQIFDAAQRLRITNKYPGGITIYPPEGGELYRVTNVDIATLDTDTPTDDTAVVLTYAAYSPRLVALGYTQTAGLGMQTDFEGTVDPSVSFVYKQDYDLGDIVKIKNEYGISVLARIVEAIEVTDQSGYRLEIKLEYQ